MLRHATNCLTNRLYFMSFLFQFLCVLTPSINTIIKNKLIHIQNINKIVELSLVFANLSSYRRGLFAASLEKGQRLTLDYNIYFLTLSNWCCPRVKRIFITPFLVTIFSQNNTFCFPLKHNWTFLVYKNILKTYIPSLYTLPQA